MSQRRSWLLAGLVVISCTVVGWFSARWIQPVYQSEFSALILRPNHEFSDFKPEQNFNRWVWARDGLAIQEGLITDQFLITAIQSIPELNTVSKGATPQESQSEPSSQTIAALRSRVEVVFGGAESHLFTIRFKDQSSTAALKFSQFARDQMQNYVRSNTIGAIETAIKGIDQQIKGAVSAETRQLQRTREQLQTQWTLLTSDFDRQFRVIKQPQLLAAPIWPKPKLLAALGLILGLFCVSAGLLFRRIIAQKWS